MRAENIKITTYVGTYTNGESEGIYKFTLDTKSGKIENLQLAATLDNPTYLCVDKYNKHLYSVVKLDNRGGVASLLIDSSTEKLKLINYQVSEGKPPCHVNIDSDNKYLFSANYHKGTIEVFPVNIDGSISSPSSIVTHEGSGPNKNQEKAHVHYVALDSEEKYLHAVDLGIDKLVVYDFNEGILWKSNHSSISLKPGCGPRHMTFHPNGKFAYIICELSSEIIALEYDKLTYKFKEIQYISTLPEGYIGENSGGAIQISADGNYLYASNRGHDSIVIFNIDNISGKLKLVDHTSTEGSHPRDFNIDPTGRFLIVANQNSNNVVSFSIDNITGKLTEINSNINIPNPVCIKFLNM
ncbi:lactonase family protein [Clostridium sp. DJ247]|uniref:lactonase family protein n=1 Tax=Clostridium sp. DJ247 TaxID=2726188 RepID=UPI001629AEFB|nr:lactonase family protein [Clostridium sp. DJ247]MBC2581468.1 lactonase family protein [Clostridium sp. DJ247]